MIGGLVSGVAFAVQVPVTVGLLTPDVAGYLIADLGRGRRPLAQLGLAALGANGLVDQPPRAVVGPGGKKVCAASSAA